MAGPDSDRPFSILGPEMGGEAAPLAIEDSVPNLVKVLLRKQGNPGLEYLDYLGRTVHW